MIGLLAYSLAGHDKGTVYVIIDETEEYVYLSDGKYRPKEKPKKKRRKHIQIIKKSVDDSLAKRIRSNETYYNEEIKRMIKLFLVGQEEKNVKIRCN